MIERRGRAGFLFEAAQPVGILRKRSGQDLIHNFVDQKPLPVGRYGIGHISGLNNPGAELEERDRRAHLEALAARRLHRHQLPVCRVIEQLPPVPSPAWTTAPPFETCRLPPPPGNLCTYTSDRPDTSVTEANH